MDKILIYREIMERYRNGDFGNDNLSMHDILERAEHPKLLEEMDLEEIQELINNSNGFSKMLFLNVRKDKNDNIENGVNCIKKEKVRKIM